MSLATKGAQLGEGDVREWLEQLSLLPSGSSEDTVPLRELIRDGVLLCQLVNKIRPGSVDTIKPKRSSGDAEENILRFLQACTSLGVKKIFKPLDLIDERRDFNSVLVTLQLLHNIAADLGLGLKVTSRKGGAQNGMSVGDSGSGGEELEEMDDDSGKHVVRALYAFNGSNDDELQFEKGDLITVMKMVDGGWWEGVCNAKVGWFPGNYVEEFQGDADSSQMGEADSAHHYHNLVVKDILDSERTYVQDIHAVLSVYLVPLKIANIVSPHEVDQLTGNLPELSKWQQGFFKSLEDCSRLPVPQQNMGTIFLKVSQEIENLYRTYCANHPKAVAVLTENSDKLSSFMESKGAASPGMLTLTSNLSKPFRRLEKYPGLLKELQRHLTEGHADSDNVSKAIDTYNAISARTQEIRKRKEMEHEMLTNPVKGFSGKCLMELGECKCVIPANQALSAEEVDEVYYLVFPSYFVILAVGQSLSGYEIKSNFPVSSVSIKRGQHSEQWPWPVEVLHKQETIHASLSSDRDRQLLIASVGRQEGMPTTPTTPSRAPHRADGAKALSKAASAQVLGLGTTYPSRSRKSSVPIHRPHHWGFKSLRPSAPLKTQHLIALRERDKATKKYNYPGAKSKHKKRNSKHLDDLLASAPKFPIENKAGDSDILRVIEMYTAGGRAGAIHTDRLITHVAPRSLSHSGRDRHVGGGGSVNLGRSHHSAFVEDFNALQIQESKSKSSTLPGSRSREPPSPSHLAPSHNLPGYPYRPPSPEPPGKKASHKRSLFRRRAESVDNYRVKS